MSSVFFVDIWSDVVCPFCYLGYRQFHDALSRFAHREHVVVRHHAFELDPQAPPADGTPLNEMLATKYAIPVEQAAAMNQRVHDSARELGMEWSLATAKPTNTFDAHRVIACAARQDRQDAMLERLFRAYFCEGLLVSDHDTLVDLARETGVHGVAELLASDRDADTVRHDEHLAARIGITGVPALIFNGLVHVSGARGSDAMADALSTAWSARSEVSA
ncbi:MAG: DsbA family oxidoreductase [Acidobacteria bacterium]|nr:DsbA family oxidoreductase [Acidobacteriota bacterium]